MIDAYDLAGLISALIIWSIVVPCFIKYPGTTTATDYKLKSIVGTPWKEKKKKKHLSDEEDTNMFRTKDFDEDRNNTLEGTPELSLSGSADSTPIDGKYIEIFVRSGTIHNVD